MPAEGALEVSCLKFPNLDGAVLRAGGQGGVLWMEGESGDVGFVSFEFQFGWGDWYVCIF